MDRHQWHSPDSQAASDYVEGRLKDRRNFEEHLDECTRCRLDVEALQRMRGRTRTWAEEEPYQQPRTYRPLFSGLAMALPLLLVLAGLYLGRTWFAPQPPSTGQWQTSATERTISVEGQSVRLSPHSQLERLGPRRLKLVSGLIRVRGKSKGFKWETDQLVIFASQGDFELSHAKGLSHVLLVSGKLQLRQHGTGKVFTLDSKHLEWPSLAPLRPKTKQKQPLNPGVKK